MIIANPIYDVVFKRLMENERVAKFFISTLIGEEILSLEVRPQEFTYSDESVSIAIFRLDFIAIIKTASGENKKILIEIQKAKKQIDLMRFRNYLAEQYKKEDVVDGKKQVLPVTTIYILGFKIPKIESACFHVKRQYIDMIDNKIIEDKSDFVERLTHDSYVVQVLRVGERYQTRLDKLLSIFEQRHFADDRGITKEYLHQIDEENLKIITDILHYSGTNPKERKAIEVEQEAWRSINAMFEEKERNYEEKLAAKDEELGATYQELNAKDKQLDETNKELGDALRLIQELQDKLKDK